MQRAIARAPSMQKKKIKTMLMLVTWHIRNERNSRTFRGKITQVCGIAATMRHDMDQWKLAVAKCLEPPLGDPG